MHDLAARREKPEEFVAYRISGWDVPFWVSPNRSAARYNKAYSGPTQYLSLHPLTPWAEYLRAQEWRSLEALQELRIRTWVIRTSVSNVIDVSFESASTLGIQAEDLVSDDYSATQDLAERCRDDPDLPDALVVPSASLPGTKNLVIFNPLVATSYSHWPVDEGDGSTTVTAERGQALTSLLDHVRFRGTPHAELEDWKLGREYVFREPQIPRLRTANSAELRRCRS